MCIFLHPQGTQCSPKQDWKEVSKKKACAKKENANNQNEHVAKAKEHKVEALEVTKKVDHHKNIENKGGYEGKIFKMDTKWVRSFPK